MSKSNRKLKVYIAGPITKGNLRCNIAKASATFHELMRLGFAPMCPHWSAFSGYPYEHDGVTKFLPERFPRNTTHSDWLGVGIAWVESSDAVLRLPGESRGADIEVEAADAANIPVFNNITDLVDWRESKMTQSKLREPDVIAWSEIQARFQEVEKAGRGVHASTRIVAGIGPDAPTVVSANSSRQSHLPYRVDLLPPLAALAISSVIKHGADKYGADNWRLIPANDHLNHALVHMFSHLAGDTQDAHLEHAACRTLMALETQITSIRERSQNLSCAKQNAELSATT